LSIAVRLKIVDEALALIVTEAGILICPVGKFVMVTGKSALKSPLRVTTQRTSAVEPSESEPVATFRNSLFTAVTEFAEYLYYLLLFLKIPQMRQMVERYFNFALPEKRIHQEFDYNFYVGL
jgi:hypothetical protein